LRQADGQKRTTVSISGNFIICSSLTLLQGLRGNAVSMGVYLKPLFDSLAKISIYIYLYLMSTRNVQEKGTMEVKIKSKTSIK
jgi:hypothetical protein